MTFGPTVIFIIVAAIAGYLLGILDSRVTAAFRKKSELPSRPDDVLEKVSENPGERTVIKFSVDADHKWHVELDNIRLGAPDTISADQRQRLVSALVQMRPWLDGKPSSTPTAVSAPTSGFQMPAAESHSPKSSGAQTSDNQTPFKINFMKGINSMVSREVKSPSELKPISIVAMIDDVLQSKLTDSPLRERGIKLEDGLLGEVIVSVGSQRYVGVSSVPDPEIREIIQSAIADWEKR